MADGKMEIRVQSKEYFITRIWSFDLSALNGHHGPWMERIEALRGVKPEAAGRSNRAGWNSDGNLFLEDVLKPLKAACEKCFQHAFKEMEVDAGLEFILHGWVNLTGPGGYNVQHGHPRTYLSGCYYLDVPEHSGRISFSDPRSGATYSPLRVNSFMGSGRVKIQPKKGQLLIFPAWLEHSVELNESPQERVAIAMNAVPPPPRITK